MTYYTDKALTYKNGFFEREIYWDRGMLKQLGNGFLIQKIIRKTTSNTFQIPPESKDAFEHTYCEVWKIKNGSPGQNFQNPLPTKLVGSPKTNFCPTWAEVENHFAAICTEVE